MADNFIVISCLCKTAHIRLLCRITLQDLSLSTVPPGGGNSGGSFRVVVLAPTFSCLRVSCSSPFEDGSGSSACSIPNSNLVVMPQMLVFEGWCDSLVRPEVLSHSLTPVAAADFPKGFVVMKLCRDFNRLVVDV